MTAEPDKVDSPHGIEGGSSVASGGSDSNTTVPPAAAGVLGADFSVRLISGLVLAVLAIGLTWGGVWPFAAMIALMSGLMSWEWARVVRSTDLDMAMVAQIIAVLAACLLTALGAPLAAIGIVAITLFGILAMDTAGHARLSVVGVVYAGLPAIALIWLRSDPVYGWPAVLLLLFIVWATDTGAFVAGRLIGGPKLWPRVSPKKTWAGLGGGALAGAAVGMIFGHIYGLGSLAGFAVFGAALAAVAQLGDLAESALKRHFGVKDSSNIIPGHGGVLDRVDGLVVVSVAAAIIAMLINPSAPGAALLLRGL